VEESTKLRSRPLYYWKIQVIRMFCNMLMMFAHTHPSISMPKPGLGTWGDTKIIKACPLWTRSYASGITALILRIF